MGEVRQCRQMIWKKDLEENFNVCPKCDKHFRIDARTRLAKLFDDGEYESSRRQSGLHRSAEIHRSEVLCRSLKSAQEDTGLTDAIINARGK